MMLSKPKSGWTNFTLQGCNTYGLSYLDDIAFEWIDQAIHGLEKIIPFCVKGFLEPDRLLCTVSYWNCHIIIEDDERYLLDEEDVTNEVSHTSMIEFCKYLHEDISLNIKEWVHFMDYEEFDAEKKTKILEQKLDRLKELISEKELYFEENRCFL